MTTTIRLDADLEQRLSALAKRTGRTKSYYIRSAVQEMIEDMEDVYFAEQALEKDDGTRYTLEQVMEMNGITQADLDKVDLSDLDD